MAPIRADEVLRRAALAALVAGSLLLAGSGSGPVAWAEETDPSDEHVYFFSQPDASAREAIRHAIEDRFLGSLPSERAQGRALCLEYPYWSVEHLVRQIGRGARSRQATQRWNAVLTLGRIRDPRARDALRRLVHDDPSASVQAFSCLALGAYEDPRDLKDLEEVLRSAKSDQWVVAAAVFAIAKIGGERAEEILLFHLRHPSTGAPKRRALLVALSFFPTAGAAEATIPYVRRSGRDRPRGYDDTRNRLRALLARVGGAFGPRADRIEELQAVFEHRREDGEMRAMALLALARFADHRRGTAYLVAGLGDSDSNVVEAAAKALQRRGDPAAREALLARLSMPESSSKLIAQLMMGLAAVTRANPLASDVDALLRKLGHHDDAVRSYVAVSLASIGSGWDAIPEKRRDAIRALDIKLSDSIRVREAVRNNYVRARETLDPDRRVGTETTEWTSPWSVDDPVLETLDRSLYELFLDRVNWFFEHEMDVHSIRDGGVFGRDRDRVVQTEQSPLRDLREWLLEEPYFSEADLPDHGYGAE